MTNVEIQGEPPPSVTGGAIKIVAEAILGSEQPDTDFELSLAFVSASEMRNYNRLYRGKDSCTDVLSFEGEELLLDGRKTRLCDIIIDTNQVFQQKGSKTFSEEFWLVLIHGLLHVCGHDHIRTADKKKMEDAEDNYRKLIPGGGIE